MGSHKGVTGGVSQRSHWWGLPEGEAVAKGSCLLTGSPVGLNQRCDGQGRLTGCLDTTPATRSRWWVKGRASWLAGGAGLAWLEDWETAAWSSPKGVPCVGAGPHCGSPQQRPPAQCLPHDA